MKTFKLSSALLVTVLCSLAFVPQLSAKSHRSTSFSFNLNVDSPRYNAGYVETWRPAYYAPPCYQEQVYYTQPYYQQPVVIERGPVVVERAYPVRAYYQPQRNYWAY